MHTQQELVAWRRIAQTGRCCMSSEIVFFWLLVLPAVVALSKQSSGLLIQIGKLSNPACLFPLERVELWGRALEEREGYQRHIPALLSRCTGLLSDCLLMLPRWVLNAYRILLQAFS